MDAAMNNGIYAHTRNARGEWHMLREHLLSTANKAKCFSKGFYKGAYMDWVWLIGVLHDLGKINPLFQEYLILADQKRKAAKVPHSPWSAAYIYRRFRSWANRDDIALISAGHHAGLNDAESLKLNLSSMYQDKKLMMLMDDFFKKCMIDNCQKNLAINKLDVFQRELLIRMMFSALIDADRLDTEKHFEPDKAETRGKNEPLADLLKKLKASQKEKISESEPTIVNRVRKEVYIKCLREANSKSGFFRLTVPTGGGKTRSSLAFALRHALINGQKRIIYAIPYTSIIDQTASEYRKILGDYAILEHHSQASNKFGNEANDVTTLEGQEENMIRLHLAEENWDSNIIITTTVQLFESLFSNKAARCRKLHRLAESVIIFDEAQTLPPELLKPTMNVLKDLVENYGASIVFCTATQPALKGDYLEEFKNIVITDIITETEYKKHFGELKRVDYEILQNAVSLDELSRIVAKYPQVLVIMNTRRDAAALIAKMAESDCLHLSTLLCGAHRKKVLDEVKNRLDNKKPVRLISTQVVEAGVDLDFPVVYRALGPLDRIVQAAGRCNRNGKPEKGKVVVFRLADERSPRGPYKAGIEKTEILLWEKGSSDILHDPKIYEEYFSMLYSSLGNDLDKKKIQISRSQLDFPETASLSRIIESNTLPVVARYADYMQFLDDWRYHPSRETWRSLQPYIVNVFEWEARGYLQEGMMASISDGLYIWEGRYDDVKGIEKIQYDPSDLII